MAEDKIKDQLRKVIQAQKQQQSQAIAVKAELAVIKAEEQARQTE